MSKNREKKKDKVGFSQLAVGLYRIVNDVRKTKEERVSMQDGRDEAYRLTSSADWAMKKPCVLDEILAPRGLIEILESSPSSDLSSMASSSSLSLVKHSLPNETNID